MSGAALRPGGVFARLVLLAAVLLPLGPAGPAAAQDAGVVPIVSTEAVAVVEDAAAHDASGSEVWTDPAAADAGWVDPAVAAEGSAPVAEEWVDPAAMVVEAPAEALPAIEPSLAPPPSVALAPEAIDWVPPAAVYVAETGQSVSGAFLDVWRAWGGALSWGYPITPEFEENGRTVQYYGFGRFEWVPDDPNGEVVQFGRIGEQMRPFMLRRGLAGRGEAAAAAGRAARAWIPLPADPAPDDLSVRFVADTGHTVTGDILAFWTQTGEAAYLGNPVSEAYEANGLTYQVFERGMVVQEPGGWPYVLPVGQLLASRLGLDTSPSPQGDLPTYSEALWTPPAPPVLAGDPSLADPNGERRVLVSLSKQYLWAYQGETVMWQGFVSTGREGFETPTGSFRVLNKIKVQTMEGVIGGEYYNVPNVPDVMYFTNVGHALHGTYWHNNFGTPMSHGCINLPMDVAAWMYQWSPMGMRVDIVP